MGDDLQRQRDALLARLGVSDEQLADLRASLAKEQEDVSAARKRIQAGADISKLVMEKELREAAVAAQNVQAALAAHNDLLAQLTQLDHAIALKDPVQLAREAAAKQASSEIAAMGDRAHDQQLMDLAARIEAIDMELVPLTAALTAAHEATATLAEALHSIAEAKRDGTKQERTELRLIQIAEQKRDAFYRALRDLPPPDDETPRLCDTLDGDDRAPYTGELGPRLQRLGVLAEEVRTRHAEVAQRRLAFETQRTRVRTGT